MYAFCVTCRCLFSLDHIILHLLLLSYISKMLLAYLQTPYPYRSLRTYSRFSAVRTHWCIRTWAYMCKNQVCIQYIISSRTETKVSSSGGGGPVLSSYRKLWLRNWNSLCALVSMAARSHHVHTTASNFLPFSDMRWWFDKELIIQFILCLQGW